LSFTLLACTGHVAARDPLQRSFSTPIVPENIGTLNDVNLQNRHKVNNAMADIRAEPADGKIVCFKHHPK